MEREKDHTEAMRWKLLFDDIQQHQKFLEDG